MSARLTSRTNWQAPSETTQSSAENTISLLEDLDGASADGVGHATRVKVTHQFSKSRPDQIPMGLWTKAIDEEIDHRPHRRREVPGVGIATFESAAAGVIRRLVPTPMTKRALRARANYRASAAAASCGQAPTGAHVELRASTGAAPEAAIAWIAASVTSTSLADTSR